MIKYKSIKITIPADSEASDVILSIPAGNKVTLRAMAGNLASGCVYFMEIQGNRFIRYYAENTNGYGKYVPLDMEVNGAEDIRVGAEDNGGGAEDTYMTLMYEE